MELMEGKSTTNWPKMFFGVLAFVLFTIVVFFASVYVFQKIRAREAKQEMAPGFNYKDAKPIKEPFEPLSASGSSESSSTPKQK